MTDDIEWGEWTDDYDPLIDGMDYQKQRVGRLTQWRVRKSPPAPVVETMTCLGKVERRTEFSGFAIWNCIGFPGSPAFALTFQTRDGAVDTTVAPTVEWVK